MTDTDITAPESKAPEEAESSTKRKPALTPLLLATLFTFQLGLGGYVYWAHHQATQRAPHNSDTDHTRMQALEDELLAQSELIEALEADIVALTDSNDETARFNLQQESLAELNARLEALENKPALSPGAMTDYQLSEMQRLAQEVRSMKAESEQAGKTRWQHIQMLTALDRLEQRFYDFEPYSQALAAFEVAAAPLAQTPDWARQLQRFAAEGIPSWEQLTIEFNSARDAALRDDGDTMQQGSLLSGVMANVSGLIEVRKTGPQHVGDDTGSVLARAEYALHQRDGAALLEELSALAENIKPIFAEFIEQLKARESIHALMPTIRDAVAANIGAEG